MIKGIWLQMNFGEIFWGEVKIDPFKGGGGALKMEMSLLFSRRQIDTNRQTINRCFAKHTRAWSSVEQQQQVVITKEKNILNLNCIICQI